ncbi:DUF4439 domain-containing protein [uncultured Friedmanniella sp.]|uniref:DUF4439 domain-containing protein n=1 Tax=uncultured Friedmanniella sp. TaxID=335381 RepID=UPI0035CB1592
MLSPRADDDSLGHSWSRRSLLAAGLAVLTTGCTLSDPAIRGGSLPVSPSSSGTASPTTPAKPSASAVAAVAERRLADLAERVRTGSPKPSAARRALLRVVGATHLERATALAAADPASRPVGQPPPAVAATGKATLARLVTAERAAAAQYRRAAESSSGLTALLWGSMAVASSRYAAALAAADTPTAAAPRRHQPMALVPDTTAVADLVAGLHAAVYGYQLALGRLEPGSATHDRAVDGLRDRRLLLGQLVERLDAAGADVPAAKPAYVPDPTPRDAKTAARLIRNLELALVPFGGLWLAAAARAADRRRALEVLTDTVARSERWGAEVLPWPGWRD